MTLLPEIRRRAGNSLAPLICICLIIYVGYHAVNGDHGLITWYRLNMQINDLKAEQAQVSAELSVMQRRTTLLKPDSLDPDLLDERAREILGYADRRDLVILLSE